MGITNFLTELKDKSQDEILLEITQRYLANLYPELKDITYRGAVLRWFNAEVLEGIIHEGDLSVGSSHEHLFATTELYEQMQHLPFSEEFPHRGYCFHDLTRKFILEYLWKNERNFYQLVSKSAQKYFENLHKIQLEKAEQGILEDSKIDWGYIIEIAYHSVIAEGNEAFEKINEIMDELRARRQMGIYHGVIEAVNEHVNAGRVSPSHTYFINFWKLKEAYTTFELTLLEEIAQLLLNEPTTPSEVKSEVNYFLADGFRLASRFNESRQYFEIYKKEQEALKNIYGVIAAETGLGDVKQATDKFEEAKTHYENALSQHVQKLKYAADESTIEAYNKLLRISQPEAWHRREVYWEEVKDDNTASGRDDAAGNGQDHQSSEKEKQIQVYYGIEFVEPDTRMEDETMNEWPVALDINLAELWLKLGYLYQSMDEYEIAAACGRLAGDIFSDVDDTSGVQSAFVLLQDLGAMHNDFEGLKKTKQFQQEILSDARTKGDQASLLFILRSQAYTDLADGEYESARNKFNEAYSLAKSLGQKNDSAICLDGLARLDWTDGKYAEAEKKFLKALEIYKQVQYSDGRVSILESLGNMSLERKNIPDAEKNFQAALDIYEELGTFSGFDLLLRLSGVKLIQGKYLESISSLENAIDLARKNKRLSAESQALSEMGKTYLLIGEFEKAELSINQALEISESKQQKQLTIDILTMIAQALMDVAEYELAISYYDDVIRIDPTQPYAYSSKGWALESLGEKHAQECLEAYEKASELLPEDYWIHKGIANALLLAGEKDKANAKYKWVVAQLRKDLVPAKLTTLAWCYYSLGEYQEAEKLYREVVKLESGAYSDNFDLALVLFCQNKYSESLEVYKEGVSLLMQKHPALCRRGFLYVAMGDLQEASVAQPGLQNSEAYIEVNRILTEAWNSTDINSFSTSVDSGGNEKK